MKKSVLFFVIGMCCVLFFTGCATTQYEGKGYLCGVVMGENNKPIPNYVVTCSSKGVDKAVATTNENGIFVMCDMKLGKYLITGKKNGYGKIYETIDFGLKDKIICFKVNSIDSVIKSVKKQIISGNYETAQKMLDDVCYEKNTPEEITILFYKSYLNCFAGEHEEALKELKKLKKLSGTKYENEIVKLEELINDFEA